ncbi:SMUG2 DNA glycosylase family protein [soil metagenome]
MDTFADRVISFNKNLNFTEPLPEDIRIMNPFKEDENILPLSSAFYRKYYNDPQPRHMILGINPGRFGGGVTGVPFTDPKRLKQECKLPYAGKETHEPSSVFVYEVIAAFGGPEAFYEKFYINSVCPLGFTKRNDQGKEVNYNYYDSKALTAAVNDFIGVSIKKQINFGIHTDVCFCFGTGQNEKFLRELNEKHHFFGKIIALEHPRFVMQYKTKSKENYIQKYLAAFSLIS